MALRLVSIGWPVVIAALWLLMRARRRPSIMAPVLFGALAATGGLMMAAAQTWTEIVAAPLALGLALVVAAMVDYTHRPADPPPPSDDDEGGGWGRWTPPPTPSPGGPDPAPEWWDEFEREFWRHVGERTPTA